MAGALAAGGAVEEFVAEECRAGAAPAKMRIAANTHIAMSGNFRMVLVWERVGGCASRVVTQIARCAACRSRAQHCGWRNADLRVSAKSLRRRTFCYHGASLRYM